MNNKTYTRLLSSFFFSEELSLHVLCFSLLYARVRARRRLDVSFMIFEFSLRSCMSPEILFSLIVSVSYGLSLCRAVLTGDIRFRRI